MIETLTEQEKETLRRLRTKERAYYRAVRKEKEFWKTVEERKEEVREKLNLKEPKEQLTEIAKGYGMTVDDLLWALSESEEAELWKQNQAKVRHQLTQVQNWNSVPDTLSAQGAAKLLDCSASLITRFCRTGWIPAHRNQYQTWVISKADLQQIAKGEPRHD